jgi:Fe2+ transport system protein B
MSTTDTDFLKERLASKQGQEALKTQSTKLADNANTFIEQKTEDVPDLQAQIKQRKLHRQAAKLDAEDAAIDEKVATKAQLLQAQAEKEQEQARIQEEGTTKERASLAREKVSGIVSQAGNTTSSLVDRVSSFKTTGGIALLLAILMLLLLIVVRVNSQGDTRLKQLWYMLNGRTSLTGKVTVTSNGVSTNTSGTFGQDPASNSVGANGGGSNFGGGNGTATFNTNLGYRGTTF